MSWLALALAILGPPLALLIGIGLMGIQQWLEGHHEDHRDRR